MKTKPIFLAVLLSLIFIITYSPSAHGSSVFVQAATSVYINTSVNSLNVTFGSSCSSGNTIFLSVNCISAATPTSFNGSGITWDNKYSISYNVTGWTFGIFRGYVSSGGETTIGIGLNGTVGNYEGLCFNAVEFTGNLTLDKTAVYSAASVTTVLSGTTAVTSFNNEVLIANCGASSDNLPNQSGATNGFTLIDGVAFTRKTNYKMSGDILYKVVTSKNNYNTQVTLSNTANVRGCIATFSITEDYRVTLYFTSGVNQILVNSTSYANGSVFSSPVQNMTYTFTLIITANYTFKNWTYNGASNTSNPFSLMVTANYTLWCFCDLGNITGGGGVYIYAKFSMNDTAPYQSVDTVFFNASESNSSSAISSYLWDFGDNDTDSGVTTTHIYSVDGVFTVNLTVVSGSMFDSMLQNITVQATTITVNFDWNDLLFGSGAWIPLIIIIAVFFCLVTWNKLAIIAALPVMILFSMMYFTFTTDVIPLVWHGLIMAISAIILLIYAAAKGK